MKTLKTKFFITFNLAQIWLFSDNLPYDEKNPDQGAFYSASYSPIFQRFVEAHKLDITPPRKSSKPSKPQIA
ncbi:hypothetical protein HPB128_21g230 [Helicobacter pylori B128]|nr:hypothetical protein HPB128_21g230 [Helicobacter pylori B128]